MSSSQRKAASSRQSVFSLLAVAAAAFGLAACTHVMSLAGTGAQRPAATEFGLGPRASADGRYVATLAPERALRPRQMQTVRVSVVDAAGAAIDGAVLTIDGGMPQHGHGLPTRPRVTQSLSAGVYEIEGIRFSMGGWWELRVTIASGAGTDSVTFNLDL